MKSKLTIIIAALGVLTIASCQKFLSIDPHFEFASTIATTSLDGLSKTTTGAFNAIQSGNLYGGGIIANSELLGDFVYADVIPDFSLSQLRSRQMDGNNASSGGMWADAYHAIYITNVVLQNAPKFASENATQVQVMKGECFFIRGIMHFELLRMFAQPSGFTGDDSHLGVPLVLVPGDVTTGQNTPRSTVAQCYAQIEADLDSAVALLPTDPNARATKVAAKGFLTRMYFTQHKYQQALTIANDLIANSGLSLNTDVTTIYSLVNSSYNPEVLFLQTSYTGATSNTGNTSTANIPDYNNGALIGNFFAKFKVPANFKCSSFFAGDSTKPFNIDSLAGGIRSKKLYADIASDFGHTVLFHYTTKYNYQFMSVPILRLPEIILDRAECNARLGADAAIVRADINLIKARGGSPLDNSTAGTQALLNAIWNERDFELAYEGDRFFEIKRRQISFVSPEDGLTYAWNSPRIVYPIPLQEVRQNKNMVQNAGY